jgi:hypothetical protein
VELTAQAQTYFDNVSPGLTDVLRTVVQGLYPGAAVKVTAESTGGYGSNLITGPRSFTINVNPAAILADSKNSTVAKSRLLKTLFHELSHPIERSYIREADQATFEAIMRQYVRERNPNSLERYALIEAFRDPDQLENPDFRSKILRASGLTEGQYLRFKASKAKVISDKSGMGSVRLESAGSDYQRSFTEWVAEQGARWITKELKNIVPKTVFEKFQKSVLDRLRKLYEGVAKALGISPGKGDFERFLSEVYGRRAIAPKFGGDRISPDSRPGADVIIPYTTLSERREGTSTVNNLIEDTEPVPANVKNLPEKMQAYEGIIRRGDDNTIKGWFNKTMRSISGAEEGETLGRALLRNSVLSNLPFLERADTRNLGKFLESHQNATGRVMGVVTIGPLGYDPVEKRFFFHDGPSDTSLLKIFEKVGVARMDQAQLVMLAQRELALRNSGSSGLNIISPVTGKRISNDELRQIVASADKDILEASRQFQKLNDKMVEMAIQTGVIPRSLGEQFKTLMYTPMYRYQEEALKANPNITLGAGIYEAIKSPGSVTAFNETLAAGGAVHGDLYENILRNYNAIVSAAVRNVAYKETADTLTKLMKAGGDTTIAEIIDKPADGTINYRVNGEDRYMVIHDQPMFLAVAALSPPEKNSWVQAASKATSLVRTGITATPPFQLRNTIRGLVV